MIQLLTYYGQAYFNDHGQPINNNDLEEISSHKLEYKNGNVLRIKSGTGFVGRATAWIEDNVLSLVKQLNSSEASKENAYHFYNDVKKATDEIAQKAYERRLENHDNIRKQAEELVTQVERRSRARKPMRVKFVNTILKEIIDLGQEVRIPVQTANDEDGYQDSLNQHQYDPYEQEPEFLLPPTYADYETKPEDYRLEVPPDYGDLFGREAPPEYRIVHSQDVARAALRREREEAKQRAKECALADFGSGCGDLERAGKRMESPAKENTLMVFNRHNKDKLDYDNECHDIYCRARENVMRAKEQEYKDMYVERICIRVDWHYNAIASGRRESAYIASKGFIFQRELRRAANEVAQKREEDINKEIARLLMLEEHEPAET